MDKSTKEMVRAVKKFGWDVDADGAGHLRLTPPDGRPPVSISSTPSDTRAMANNRAQLRRMGIDVLTGTEVEVDCQHSWHLEGTPGRSCPNCRDTWRVRVTPYTEAQDGLLQGVDPTEMLDSAFDFLARQSKAPPEPEVEVAAAEQQPKDPRPNIQRVFEVMSTLREDEYLTGGEIGELLPDLDPVQIRSSLRMLTNQDKIIRSKRGRYAMKFDRTETASTPEETTVEPLLAAVPDPPQVSGYPPGTLGAARAAAQAPQPFSPPPDPSRPWSWDPAQGWVEMTAPERAHDAPPLFEYLSTDSKGRLILKDENGDLFCAVPFAPQF